MVLKHDVDQVIVLQLSPVLTTLSAHTLWLSYLVLCDMVDTVRRRALVNLPRQALGLRLLALETLNNGRWLLEQGVVLEVGH